MRFIKILSVLFTLVLILVLAPILFFLFTDPNEFKPQIQELARKQGFELDMRGDLHWQIYPNIELQLEDTQLNSQQPGYDLDAHLGLVRLDIELQPLFAGELSVRGIRAENIDLSVAELESLESDEQPEAGRDAEISTDSLTISQVAFTDVSIKYQPIEADLLEVRIDRLVTEVPDLTGVPFPVNLTVNYTDKAWSVALATQALISADLKAQEFGFEADSLSLQIAGDQTFSIDSTISAEIDVPEGQWSVDVSGAEIEDLQFAADAAGMLDPLSASGKLQARGGIALLNQFVDLSIVNRLNLNTEFDYAPDYLKLSKLEAQVNDIHASANIDYRLSGERPSNIALSIDRINLDDYLAEEAEQTRAPSEAENPLAFMEGLPAIELQLEIAELISSGQQFTDIELSVSQANTIADVQLIQAKLAGGELKSQLRLRGLAEPQVRIDSVRAENIDLGVLAAAAAAEEGTSIEGIATLGFSGRLQSLATNALLAGLNGNGQIDVDNLKLNNLNLEENICASARQLGGSAALTSEWSQETVFGSLASPFEVRQGLLSLGNIGTGFGNIKLGGGGELNLDSMEFTAQLALEIQGERTSEQGCSINKYLRNTELPLACSGNLSAEGGTSCGLDGSVVANLLKGQIQNQLGQQLDRFLGRDQGEQTEGSNSSEEKQPSEGEQIIRGLLEGLFD